jgi:hypothetical protein
MSESEAPSESTPGPSGGGSSSPQPSSSRPSWVTAVTGTVVLVVVVARLVPLLERFAIEAMKTQHCGWEKWIPTAIVAALILGVAAPTSFRDIAQLASAAKGLLPGKK